MSRGIQRERAVRLYLEERDYVVVRAAGSLGCADLVALRAGNPTLLLEVKSTHRGPFHSFGPADRADILAYAERAGATAVLAYWPPRGKLQFIYEDAWPKDRRLAVVAQMTMEIPNAPLSRHDIDVIHFALTAARSAGYTVREIHLSTRRLSEEGLQLFGLPVRRTSLDLHRALLICDGRTPISFDLEEAL